jgi:hypothetical protein
MLINMLIQMTIWPESHNSKTIWWVLTLKLLMPQTNRLEASQTLEAILLPPTEVLSPRYGHIYIVNFGQPPTIKHYVAMIGNFPTCICIGFITMMASSLGGHGKWVHCKHLYYILQNVMYCGQTKDFIHFPTWSWNEVQHMMNCAGKLICGPSFKLYVGDRICDKVQLNSSCGIEKLV